MLRFLTSTFFFFLALLSFIIGTMDKLYFIICVSMMFSCVCYIYEDGIYSTCELMCMSECMHVREQVFIYTRMFLFSGFTHPFFIQEGKCCLISCPKLSSASGEA